MSWPEQCLAKLWSDLAHSRLRPALNGGTSPDLQITVAQEWELPSTLTRGSLALDSQR